MLAYKFILLKYRLKVDILEDKKIIYIKNMKMVF